ncbi:unnamed protein product, partial [Ectocarpus sp. 12 AP-2014]
LFSPPPPTAGAAVETFGSASKLAPARTRRGPGTSERTLPPVAAPARKGEVGFTPGGGGEYSLGATPRGLDNDDIGHFTTNFSCCCCCCCWCRCCCVAADAVAVAVIVVGVVLPSPPVC